MTMEAAPARRDWVQGRLFWASHFAGLVIAGSLLAVFLGLAVIVGGGE